MNCKREESSHEREETFREQEKTEMKGNKTLNLSDTPYSPILI